VEPLVALLMERPTTCGGSPAGIQWLPHGIHIPSGYVKIAIENGLFIVDFPIKHGDFP